jgi:hypothetical protein
MSEVLENSTLTLNPTATQATSSTETPISSSEPPQPSGVTFGTPAFFGKRNKVNRIKPPGEKPVSMVLSYEKNDNYDDGTFGKGLFHSPLSPKLFKRGVKVMVRKHGSRQYSKATIVDDTYMEDDTVNIVDIEHDDGSVEKEVDIRLLILLPTAPDQEESAASTAIPHPRSATVVACGSPSTQNYTGGTLGK